LDLWERLSSRDRFNSRLESRSHKPSETISTLQIEMPYDNGLMSGNNQKKPCRIRGRAYFFSVQSTTKMDAIYHPSRLFQPAPFFPWYRRHPLFLMV
jgi:hypothetical protein